MRKPTLKKVAEEKMNREDTTSQLNFRNKQRKKIESALQEAFGKLKMQQTNPDPERAHIEADNALCDLLTALGFENIVKEYQKIGK